MLRKQFLEPMRRFSFLLLAIVLVLSGCDSGGSNDTGLFKVDKLEEVESFGQTGLFYRADERSGLDVENKEEAQRLLVDLRKRGTVFEAAFFRRPSNGCAWPGGDGVVQPVVVPAQMILRLSEQPSDPELPDSFEEMRGEASMLCPYNVVRFRPRHP